MKSVPIRSFSGPYFPSFGLNTEKFSRGITFANAIYFLNFAGFIFDNWLFSDFSRILIFAINVSKNFSWSFIFANHDHLKVPVSTFSNFPNLFEEVIYKNQINKLMDDKFSNLLIVLRKNQSTPLLNIVGKWKKCVIKNAKWGFFYRPFKNMSYLRSFSFYF